MPHRRLHITNGDSAAARLGELLPGEPILPWRDILHDGPVPGGLGLAALSAVRATHIAGRGWGELAETLAAFRARDEAAAHLADYAEVALWFEHDLYDQLQLIQVLDLAVCQGVAPGRLLLAQADDHLGSMPDAALGALAPRAVSAAELAVGTRAWTAFRAPTPEPVAALASEALPLPHLAAALVRWLEELPAPETGLGRSERQIVEVLAEGPSTPSRLFTACGAQEAAVFLGDMPFFAILGDLGDGAEALVRGLPGPYPAAPRAPGPAQRAWVEAEVTLGEHGRAALAGRRDRLRSAPWRRWWGGTLLGPGCVWRYDPAERALSRDPV